MPVSGHLPAGPCPSHPSKALLRLGSLVLFLGLSVLLFSFPQSVRISPVIWACRLICDSRISNLVFVTLLLPAGSWLLTDAASAGSSHPPPSHAWYRLTVHEVRWHGLFPVKRVGLWSGFHLSNFGSAWLWGGLLPSFVRWADATSLCRADLGQLWSRALLRPPPDDVEPGYYCIRPQSDMEPVCCVRVFQALDDRSMDSSWPSWSCGASC